MFHLIVSVSESVGFIGLKTNVNASTQISKDLGRMKRFSAEEALEYGLIDRIARPPHIKADAPRKEAGTGLG